MLIHEKPIPEKYKNHKLTGNYSGMMELALVLAPAQTSIHQKKFTVMPCFCLVVE